MKISRNALKSFNNNIELKLNDAYNKNHNLGTLTERMILNEISISYHGMFKKRLTMNMVNSWLEECLPHSNIDIEKYKKKLSKLGINE